VSLITIVTLQAKPGSETRLAAALNEVAPPTRSQPGCLSFLAARAEGDSAQFTVFQHWDSKQSHDDNTQLPHIAKFMSAVGNILALPPTMTWHEVLG